MALEHACPGISPRTLSERLDMLEREGVAMRRSYPESPPRVEYQLRREGASSDHPGNEPLRARVDDSRACEAAADDVRAQVGRS